MEQEKCVTLSKPTVTNFLTADNLIFFRFIIKRKDGKENKQPQPETRNVVFHTNHRLKTNSRSVAGVRHEPQAASWRRDYVELTSAGLPKFNRRLGKPKK